MNFGLSPDTLVHRLANIAGNLKAGKHCRIDAFVTVTGDVTLGDYCHLSTGSGIWGGAGFKAGNGCVLSPGAKVFTATDDPDSDMVASFSGCPIPHYSKSAPVIFGNYVVIGANSIVLPGVVIGHEVQVGALSLVNRQLPGQGIYAGVPAKFIRARKKLVYG